MRINIKKSHSRNQLQKSTTDSGWRGYRWHVAPLSLSLSLFYWDLMKPPPPPHLTHPCNDRRHLALWTWRDSIQDEMEAYFGKPTKALKCKPPAACLAADVFVLVQGAAVAFHPGTRQKRRAMCGLLIFKPPVCQASAVGMRRRGHAHTNLSPTIPRFLAGSLRAWTAASREVTSAAGAPTSLFTICLEITLWTGETWFKSKSLRGSFNLSKQEKLHFLDQTGGNLRAERLHWKMVKNETNRR